MVFWVRETAGWLLVLAGGYIILLSLASVGERQVIEGAILAGIGIVVFRGGIHLIKVATAARVVLRANDRRKSSKQKEVGGRGTAPSRNLS